MALQLQAATLAVQANFTILEALGGGFGNAPINADLGGNPLGAQLNFTGVGAGAGNLNWLHSAGHSVTAGTPLSLALTGGAGVAITMPDGQVVTATDILVFIVKNTGLSNLTVGGGTGAVTTIFGATGTAIILPGSTSVFAFSNAAAGYGVTASTADKLQFVAASGTNPFDLVLAGH